MRASVGALAGRGRPGTMPDQDTARGRHAAAREDLLRQFARIPAGAPVRLAKRTSNLFRPRARTTVPGLDVGGLDCRAGGGRRGPDRGRAGDDHVRAPGRRDAAARADADGGPAAEDDHPRRRGDRARHRVDARSAAACRTRRSASWRCSPARARSWWPRPDGPHADLFRAFPNSYGTLGYALRLLIELEPVRPFVRLRHLRFGDDRTRWPTRSARSSPRGRTTGSRSTSSTAPSSPRTRPT